ncbi:MAG TPA: hypothetical protein PKH23_04005 [Bacillota bacterium]|nr:hypothetical protein [Bacillota bacterium]
MLKLVGYFLTIFYMTGVFFPALLPAMILLISQMAGHAAFALFALLIARGMRRSTNHFLYFIRLVIAAFASEIIAVIAAWQLRIAFIERNALFTYAASLAMLAGLSMMVGCYRDLVAHVIPADGKWDQKPLFGVPVNPGNYRMSPVVGIVIGLLTVGLSVFVTLFFHFSHGVFGLLFVTAAFLAMGGKEDQPNTRFRHSLFASPTWLLRTLLYVVALVLVFALVDIIVYRSGSAYTFTRLAVLLSVPLAVVLPEPSKPPKALRRWLTYAALPLMLALITIVRWFVS